ncbi:MAG TPA: 4-hydroxyphenylacetate 3-hydroxylase N-terminal domain-containing protein [Thermoanaerobaculia bacterium]|nr:4-hydroxyphenylacetate 3-hydroxylase N-terminal domain-containing protein [Thermoanaerobaculia bacterium]
MSIAAESVPEAAPSPEAEPPIVTGEDYIRSLRGRGLRVFLFGELVPEPVDHPVIRPSINAVAETYDLAVRHPELATAISPLTGERINRFLHIAGSAEDLVMQNKMQRKLGQLTGTCFQRCVGMDAFNALHSVTYEIDEQHGTHGTRYHERLKAFLTRVQRRNQVVGGAMTDVKGDRSKAPHQQDDPDLYVHVTKRTDEGVWIRGAKAHQTGCINSHWMIVMPTLRLGPEDRDFAVVGAVPVDAPGITYLYGRQSCDTRHAEGSGMDAGNARFSGQEAMVVFDDVFIPNPLVFMDGEAEFAAMLVERFTCYHRRSYVCKSRVGDVLIGAAAAIAECNGVDKASHVKDKLVEMTHLNETIYSTGIASSYQARPLKSGCYLNDDMIANVCKHHVTKMPYEIGRLAQDLAGGLMVTMPSEKDLESAETGDLLRKYLRGRADVPVETRMRILRLIENMTLGRNAVGYLTESMHGAGSPQAQRIQIARQMELDYKKRLARRLAGVDEKEPAPEEGGYFERVFEPEP